MKLFVAMAAFALLTAPAMSAACRDAKGKFIKCPPVAMAKGGGGIVKGNDGKCRDAKGHFAKCPK